MIYLYLFALFMSGYLLASLTLLNLKSITGRLAAAPVLGAGLPVMIFLILNTLTLEITRTSFLIPWALILVFLVVKQHQKLITLLNKTCDFIKAQSFLNNVILLLITLSFAGYFLMNFITPVFPGDGLEHWGRKAVAWTTMGQISYPEIVRAEINIWAAYPIWHSLVMMVNLLFFPSMPETVAINNLDSFFVLGIFFTAIYAFKNLGVKAKYLPALAVFFTFSCREIVAASSWGYAEIELSYLLFLFTSIIYFEWKHHKELPGIFLGAVFAILTCTKGEGWMRGVIALLGLFAFVPYRRQFFMASLRMIPSCAVVFILQTINHPAPDAISPFVMGGFITSPQVIMTNIGASFNTLYLSIILPTYSKMEAYWPVSFGLVIFFMVTALINKKMLYRREIFLFGSIFGMNIIFNLLPFILLAHGYDPRMREAITYVSFALIRLNSQVYPMLSMVCIMGFLYFILRPVEKNTL